MRSPSTHAGRLVLAYLQAFNSRDHRGLEACFSTNLVTIHPDDPDIDVCISQPFIERMTNLWERDYFYNLHSLYEQHGENEGSSSAVAHFSIGCVGASPGATEFVEYLCSERIDTITVFKLMKPSHHLYRRPIVLPGL